MDNNGIRLEETLVATLEALEGLKDRVCPVIDIQKSTGPLIVYDQRSEGDEQDLSGDSGLSAAVYQLHILHGTYLKMRRLSEMAKTAVKALRGKTDGVLTIEAVTVELASPDILENKVQLFRRTYNVKISYQIKEDN